MLRTLIAGFGFLSIIVVAAMIVQAKLTHTASRERSIVLYAPDCDVRSASRYYEEAAKALEDYLLARGIVPATQPVSWRGKKRLYEHTVVRDRWHVMHS